MELFLVLLVLFFILAPLIALAKSSNAAKRVEDLEFTVRHLEAELGKVRRELEARTKVEPKPTTVAPEPTISKPMVAEPPVIPSVQPEKAPEPEPVPTAPLPEPPLIQPAPAGTEPFPAPPPSRWAMPTINWEQLMGVKLFAWIGGLALFIGVALFLKYSFEHNLIPPALRATMGFLAGVGLVIGGLRLSNKQYTVTSQTLCATGVVILYAVTFACRAIYHFPFFGQITTFALMTLITAIAFTLSVRMNALVVAILGMLGGFLTPVLLSTGTDNPFGLFTYIALLDIGLIAVALHRRWYFLSLLSALGTLLMQIGWNANYFTAEKVYVALAIFSTFNVLYFAAVAVAKRLERVSDWICGAAVLLPSFTFLYTFYLLSFDALGSRPGILFSFALIADLCVIGIVLMHTRLFLAHIIAGGAVFAALATWTWGYLNLALLNWGLGLYLLFAVLHSAFPIVMQRWRPGSTSTWWPQLFPPIALLLLIIPILKLPELPLLVWFCVLLIDVLAIAIALATASMLSMFLGIVITVIAMAAWLIKTPSVSILPNSLLVIVGFSLFFFIGCLLAAEKILARWDADPEAHFKRSEFPFFEKRANALALLPACSAILPFLLLIMLTLKLPLAQANAIYGVAMVLSVMILGLAAALRQDLLPAVGLVCVLVLQLAWRSHDLHPGQLQQQLAWSVAFAVVFALFPFLFHRRLAEQRITWGAGALSLVLHFFFIYSLVLALFPKTFIGLLPATMAIPPFLGMWFLLRNVPSESPYKMEQLAWFAGVGLFFVTLIFPVQFEREWITIGWALEGAALLWLFHWIPHPGLRGVGVALLLIAFIRLAINPAVLAYHPRSETPILNWYLYTYLVVAGSLFAGARLLKPADLRLIGTRVAPVLYSLGTILLFLLLNIEIADYFSEPGVATLTFEFSGNFARDMTYTISWALFAFVLLLIGILKKLPGVRYAALGLLGLTLLKLFFHDLAHLKQLYRIGALISVAIIAILASFIYQKFLSTNGEEPSKTKGEETK